MAACKETMENKNSIAAELLRLTQRVDYCRTIKPLKLLETMTITDFDGLELATLFELDTTKCFTGKKKVKFNKYCIYDIFTSYCGLDRFVLKDMVNKEIRDNMAWYTKVSHMCLGWKDTNLQSWLKKQAYKCTMPDDLCVYALSVIFRHHTIAYTVFQPWCTIDMKPGFSLQKVLEACETKLLYLGDNLFGELHCKPTGNVPPPQINLEELHAARRLYRDPNLLEMYIEHAGSSALNAVNTQIVRPETTYISATDITKILPSKPSLFDTDYIPEVKVEPQDEGIISSFTLTESLGSNLGEIVFPVPVKQKMAETVENILTTHSPTCQLRLQITDIYSIPTEASKTVDSTNGTTDTNNDWSLDANLQSSLQTAAGSQESTSPSS